MPKFEKKPKLTILKPKCLNKAKSSKLGFKTANLATLTDHFLLAIII